MTELGDFETAIQQLADAARGAAQATAELAASVRSLTARASLDQGEHAPDRDCSP